MSLERCLLADGSSVLIADIKCKLALSVFQTDLFYQICEFLARLHELDRLEHKVLVNLYALKSSRVKDIAALIYYVNEHRSDVIEIHALDDTIAVLRSLVAGERIVFQSIGEAPSSYIEKSFRLSIAMKIILNRLFRLVPTRVQISQSIVRGWVDVTEAMYPEEVLTSSLLLYPFPYGIARQFRFFRSVRRRGGDVRLAGLPYSLLGLWRLLSGGRAIDVHIVDIETSAYQRYAQELIRRGVRRVHTSDEFEVGAVAMYEPLIEAGVTVLNTAHGVGLYSPYVAYSEFKGVNAAQSAFYQQRCIELKSGLRKGKNTTLPLATADACRSLPPAIVLVDQNFLAFNCTAEADALLETQRILEAFCASAKVPLFIKVHPNSSPTELSSGSEQIRTWAAINGFRPIFVTVNSTAFYDVQGYGPILVCDEPSFLPENCFGSDLLVYRYATLPAIIEVLMSESAWWSAASKHMPNTGD